VREQLVRKFDAGRNACLKCFYATVSAPQAGLYHPHINQTLVIDFDKQANPHLGVLTFEGYAPTLNAPYRNKLFFALEPTSGVGDDHAGGKATGTLRQFKPGETLRFITKLSVESGKAKIG
jgi:galactose mutarotase-like enzyme